MRTTPEGVRLFMNPVREIETHPRPEADVVGRGPQPEDNPLAALTGDLWEIQATIEPGDGDRSRLDRSAANRCVMTSRRRQLSCLGHRRRWKPVDGRIKLHVLVDRTSIEVFANDGRIAMCSCFLPDPLNRISGPVRQGRHGEVKSLNIWELQSSWPSEPP